MFSLMSKRACSRCLQLERRIAELEAQFRELTARLGTNASNSSLPPSANPPDAPKPVVKTPSGKKPGGQPGHPGHHRLRLPPERLAAVVHYRPEHCDRCQTPLPPEPGPQDPPPTWHQVAELPTQLATVVEHQGHARTCPCCAAVTWATIPDDIRAHAFGPRLTASVAYLSGSPHVSKRGIEELVETLFGVPIGLGTVCNLEQEVSAALEKPHAEAQQAVAAAPVKNVDETGWKQAGRTTWLWAAATATVACFVIYPGRGAAGLAALLGATVRGIVGSDRWSAYHQLAVERRQLCWAHLKRDFQKCVDRGGPSKAFGEAGLAAVALVFDAWHRFRGGGLDRAGLRKEIGRWRKKLRAWLKEECDCADAKTAAFCQNLLKVEPALWTFVEQAGVEPTNNHIERLLRSGVLWRKNAFGCASDRGCRFVERILTVVQTQRLQKQPVLEYLERAVQALRHGKSAPKLLLGV